MSCPFGTAALIKGDGAAPASVMVVGAYPGVQEEKEAKSFAGSLGGLVRGVLAGIAGEDVYFTLLVKRRPEKAPSPWAIGGCAAHIAEEVRAISPKVIVTLGSIATSYFIGRQIRMSDVRGLPIQSSRFHRNFIVLPAYDIGHVMRRGGLNSPVGHDWIDDLEEIHGILAKVN